MCKTHTILLAAVAAISASIVFQPSALASTFFLKGYAGTSSASDQTADSTDGSVISLSIPNTLSVPTTGDRSATASGSVSTGIVSVTAESAVTAGTPSIGDIEAKMDGGWVESMTIFAADPLLDGTAGLTSFGVDIDGFLYGGGESIRAYYSANLIAGTSFDSEGNVLGTQTTVSGELLTYEVDNVNADGSLGSTRVEFIDLPITFGEAFNVQFVLSAIAEIGFEGTSSEQIYAHSDLGHTATWGGVTSVKTAAGELITEFTVVNADGVDFKNAFQVAPVPLPAALPLLLSALGVFGFFGSRRKRLAAA
jgi:hypothetical protein